MPTSGDDAGVALFSAGRGGESNGLYDGERVIPPPKAEAIAGGAGAVGGWFGNWASW